MVLSIACAGVLVVLAAVAVAVRHARRDGRRRHPDAVVLVTAMGVVGCVLLVIALQLVVEPGEDMKTVLATGVVGAGVITAIFALWLNHRRYRVDEARQQVERDKADLERGRHRLEQEKVELEHAKDRREHDKVADEIVIRAVELFGHDRPAVRGGTLHALAGLAAQRPDRAQEVTDLVCMYLRHADGEDAAAAEAQRVLLDIVTRASAATPPVHDLAVDLTGARLRDFAFDGASVRVLVLARAHLSGVTSLRGLGSGTGREPRCGVVLDGAAFTGDVRLHKACLLRLSACEAEFGADLSMEGAWVEQDVLLSDTSITGDADFSGAEFGGLNCNAAAFGEKASFRRLVLRGGATFLQARFGRADFEKLVSRHKVVFDGAHFEGPPRMDVAGGPHDVSLWRTTLSAAAAADDQLLLPGRWRVVDAGRDGVRYLVRPA